ncbi:hypothetical protein A3782_03705 [Bacillus sp. GZT]|nr:hypothetical protein A3782_03705 [Bacillus sp. GZT]
MPNRVPCHVQTRDVEQVLGEWKKWIAERFLEELVNNFLLFCWNRSSSHAWWRSVPNRVPCHVQTRDVEQVLGEWKKWIAENFLEELVNNFLLFCWNRSSSHAWWRSVPNRVPCHVQTRDVEQVLGEWKKWIAERFLEELVNNFLLFFWNRKLAMCDSGQCLIEPRVM